MDKYEIIFPNQSIKTLVERKFEFVFIYSRLLNDGRIVVLTVSQEFAALIEKEIGLLTHIPESWDKKNEMIF